MLAARTTRRHEKRNKHWRGKESAAESRTCQRMDTITCLLSDQSNAMCIMGSSLCDAREPVCRHENTPGELAPLKLIRPGGFVSIWSARSLHFSWNGAELWLALEEEHKRGGQLAARSPPKTPSTRAKRFHV